MQNQVFEVTLSGWDPEDSETDDRILWVKAPSRRRVLAFIRSELGQVPEEVRVLEDRAHYTAEDGVDYDLGQPPQC